eukprot:607023-Hanusia_phi.AAC.1
MTRYFSDEPRSPAVARSQIVRRVLPALESPSLHTQCPSRSLSQGTSRSPSQAEWRRTARGAPGTAATPAGAAGLSLSDLFISLRIRSEAGSECQIPDCRDGGTRRI